LWKANLRKELEMSLFVADEKISPGITAETYQIINPEGEVVGPIPNLPAEQMIAFYRWMVLGRIFSNRMVALQRQGRMGTFAPLNGQEASAVGLATLPHIVRISVMLSKAPLSWLS
jgi:hypothetical protein